MVSALFAFSGLILLAILTIAWRAHSQYVKRLRHRQDREEQELRSQGFDLDGIRQIQQLRHPSPVLSLGDSVMLASLILTLIATIDFPSAGFFFVLAVAAVLIRGAVKNAKRQKSPGADRSS